VAVGLWVQKLDEAGVVKLFIELDLPGLVVVRHHVPSEVGELGVDGMELADEDGADQTLVVGNLPQPQDIPLLLNLGPPVEFLELLVIVLLFVVRLAAVFVVLVVIAFINNIVLSCMLSIFIQQVKLGQEDLLAL